MTKKLYVVLAVILLASMALAACQTATPTEAPVVQPTAAPATEVPATEVPPTAVPPTEAPAPKLLICQVTDTGGIDDKSFNATAWKGVEDAVAQLGVEGKYLESQQQTDYEKNINAFIEAKCDLIITVGYLLGDATQAAAEANPDVKFSIVDYAYDPVIPNVLGQVFETDQAAFLAGYVAAATTQTGKVASFGGMQIPTVTVFMDGFYYGVKYYNEQHGTSVEALGWDPVAQTGSFTGNFESLDDGRALGQTFLDEGADIIMPVAGPVGQGTAAICQERGNCWIIGVDNDWTLTVPTYKDIILTSVLKKMDATTLQAIKDVQDGTFTGGVVVGSLSNEGVGLSAIAAAAANDTLTAELKDVQAGIIAGTIQTKP
jgi:basic membrane protein A